MFTLKDVAEHIGMKLNTLRYWIDKNNYDYENDSYDFNLTDLLQRVTVSKKTNSKRHIVRGYKHIVIFDLDEFTVQFKKYTDYIHKIKDKKRENNLLNWTRSALDCYYSGMCCEYCVNQDICKNIIPKEGRPPMKHAVEKLLANIGKPILKKNEY